MVMESASVFKDRIREVALTRTFLVETEEFIDAKFPFKKEAEAAFQKLKDNGLYQEGKWSGEPTAVVGDDESDSDSDSSIPEAQTIERHKFLVGLANSIKSVHEGLQGDTLRVPFRSKWVQVVRKASGWVKAPLVRPYVALLLLSKSEEKVWEELEEKIKKQIDIVQNPTEDVKDGAAILEDLLALWWSRAVVPVDVRGYEDKCSSKTHREHLEGVTGYVQQMIQEQLDRRSGLGLLLCGAKLSIWQVDRSGFLGTQVTFNIHEKPELFIQVILGCSYGDPSTLGWDPTMRLWRGEGNELLLSFHPDIGFPDYERRATNKHWVISMPSKVAADAEQASTSYEDFLTIKNLSASHTIAGKATVTWVAMRLEDVKKPNHEFLVIKQSWQPETAKGEEELLPKGVPNVSKVYSAEKVCEGNEVVTTLGNLRHGLTYSVPSVNDYGWALPLWMLYRESWGRPRGAWDLSDIVPYHAPESPWPSQEPKPVSLVQKRILFEEYGWPLHHSRSLEELLVSLKQVVQAQKTMYFDHGTLQRDVSPNNILICPTGDDHMKTHATVNDFDYGQRTESWIPSVLGCIHNLEALSASETEELEANREYFLKRVTNNRPWDPELDLFICLYLRRYDIQRFVQMETRVVHEDLPPWQIPRTIFGLLPKETLVPDFSPHPTPKGERTATIPFASSEILTSEPVTGVRKKRPLPEYTTWTAVEDYVHDCYVGSDKWFHDAIHDSEALFWTFTYICLSRFGPGRKRARGVLNLKETDVEKYGLSDADKELRQLFNELFDWEESDTRSFARKKASILRNRESEDYVTKHFSPYFEPVKTLWKEWRFILEMGHGYTSFEMLHDFVLKVLDDALVKVRGSGEEDVEKPTEDEGAVNEERRKELEYFRNFPMSEASMAETTTAGGCLALNGSGGQAEQGATEANESLCKQPQVVQHPEEQDRQTMQPLKRKSCDDADHPESSELATLNEEEVQQKKRKVNSVDSEGLTGDR